MLKQLIACGALFTVASTAMAADVTAGQAKVQQVCGKCHEAADWKGKSAAEIQAKIQSVVAGKTKHPKKLDLSDADIANVAAFWAGAGS